MTVLPSAPNLWLWVGLNLLVMEQPRKCGALDFTALVGTGSAEICWWGDKIVRGGRQDGAAGCVDYL